LTDVRQVVHENNQSHEQVLEETTGKHSKKHRISEQKRKKSRDGNKMKCPGGAVSDSQSVCAKCMCEGRREREHRQMYVQ
jgi:hypothetical protein